MGSPLTLPYLGSPVPVRSSARFGWLIVFLSSLALAQWTRMNPVLGAEQQKDGVLFRMQTGTLKLQPCTPSVIHIL